MKTKIKYNIFIILKRTLLMSESDYSKEEDFEPSKESSEEDFNEEDEDFSEEKKPKKAKKEAVVK